MNIRFERAVVWAMLAWGTAACSGDDAQEDCPEDAGAGAELSCECEDSEEEGVRICGDDGKLGECDCTGESGGGAGRGGSGRGGSGGRGGTSGSSSDDAGVDAGETDGGGGSTDDDAGTDPGPTPDAGMNPDASTGSTLPMDGNQLAVCEVDTDCDMGFTCYDRGAGQHFCTQECQDSVDCESIDGADYTCSAEGQCEVACVIGDDSTCPESMTCTSVGGPPGPPLFRCKYSTFAGQPNAGDAYSACASAGDCNDGLLCYGAFGDVPGYCTHACADTEECTERPSSGTLEPVCALATPLPGTEMCVLDCLADPEGCPAGMTCGFGARCAYQ